MPPTRWPASWADRGDLEEMRGRADAGNTYTASKLTGRLAELLAQRGRAKKQSDCGGSA